MTQSQLAKTLKPFHFGLVVHVRVIEECAGVFRIIYCSKREDYIVQHAPMQSDGSPDPEFAIIGAYPGARPAATSDPRSRMKILDDYETELEKHDPNKEWIHYQLSPDKDTIYFD